LPELEARSFVSKKPRETTPSVLKNAIVRKLGQRIVAQGALEFPCVPALLDVYMARLVSLWELLGKPFADDELARLREGLAQLLAEGYGHSSQARVVVTYQTQAPPDPGIAYNVRLAVHRVDEVYAGWVATRPAPLFGAHADAKVTDVAASLGAPAAVAVLDVGAGTGRNAVALARRGHPVTAVEPVPALAAELRKSVIAAGAAVEVVEADALSPELVLPGAPYQLAVLSEVVPHLRDATELRTLVTTVARALSPGGRLLFNAFVALEGYKPDPLARQVAEIAWCGIVTRGEIAAAVAGLPLERVGDESAYDYEKAHLPAEAWPPTDWFEDWAHGRNVFALPPGRAPIELRWLDYRRTE
jgi:SAM-dependent methyltransferase